jgi:spoIIIJ-associated protein
VAVGGNADQEAQVSRTSQGQGATLQEALTAAVAELVDTDPEKVELRLRAPGIDEVTGRLRLDLDIDDTSSAGTEQSHEEDGAGAPVEAPAPAPEQTSGAPAGGDGDPDTITAEDLDEEADAAADFLEGLLDAIDLPGDLRIHVHDDHAEVEIIDLGSGALIGRRGQTLESIQELLRCALQRQFQRRCRVKVDAEGYRARRLEKLIEKAEDAIDEVLDNGEPVRLEPMDVFERKAIHNLVAQNDGVTSRSQGREPARRVIIEVSD